MKKYFGSLRAGRYFLPLFLGVFMMSPVFAGTIYTPTSNGSLNWSGEVSCPANNYTCVNADDGKWRKEVDATLNVTDTYYFGVPSAGDLIDNVKICLWAKSNGVPNGALRTKINTPQGVVNGFGYTDYPDFVKVQRCDNYPVNPLTNENWAWTDLQGQIGYQQMGSVYYSYLVDQIYLEIDSHPSYTGGYQFAGGVASISTALFDDFGSGGILELIIGISLGLLLLDWLIGHFKRRRTKNEFATTYQN